MTDPYGVLLKALEANCLIWIQSTLPFATNTGTLLNIGGKSGRYTSSENLKSVYTNWESEEPAYTFGQYIFNCPHHNLKVPRTPPENTVFQVYLNGVHYFDLKQTDMTDNQIGERFNFYGLFAARNFQKPEIVTMYDGYLFRNGGEAGYAVDSSGNLTGTPPRSATIEENLFLDAQTRDHLMRPVDNPDMAECFGFAQFINHSASPNCNITDKGGIQAIRTINAGDELTVNYNYGLPRATNEDGYDFNNEGRRAVGNSRSRLTTIRPIFDVEIAWQLETLKKFQPNNWSLKKKKIAHSSTENPVSDYPDPLNITNSSEDANGASSSSAAASSAGASKSSE